MEYEFTDRYKALGIPYPDPETVCKGQCEGTGWVPVRFSDNDEPLRSLWIEAEEKQRSDIKGGKRRAGYLFFTKGKKGKCGRVLTDLDDGYHFVKCPDCGGTGKRE